MKMKVMAIVVLFSLAPFASAKTLTQLSTDLTMVRSAVTLVQQEDDTATKTDVRESSSELFPAVDGAKTVLTTSQQNLIKRCDRLPAKNTRCRALKCRLLGEGCKR
mgnify:CR=1 FL=1